MILEVFCVFDSKIGAYNSPFFMRSKGEAVRAFSDAVNKPDSQFFQHAGDYTLFHVGSWDDATCKFHLLATPNSIGVALEFIKKLEVK